jgi:hypothetical protein
VFDALENEGFDGLTPAQRVYFSVFIYDAEVRNGGHSQYFVNPSGKFCQEAITGLETVGALKRQEILQKAVDLFGPTGPSLDDDERHEQLAGFSAKQDDKLEELDDRYYECEEDVEVMLQMFAIQQQSDFADSRRS